MGDTGTTKSNAVDVDRTEGELTDAGQEDIVVDLPYVGLTARLLRQLDVDADPDLERVSPALGLGVVVVRDIKQVADRVEIDTPERLKLFKPRDTPKSNLDKVLVWLRQEFRRIDPEWDIPIGKCRTVQGVHGTPHIGGGGYPTAPDPTQLCAFTLGPETQPHSKVRVGLVDTRIFQHENFGDRLKFIGLGELRPVEPFNHLDLHGTFTVGLILEKAPTAEVVVKSVLRHDLAKATVWDVASVLTEFLDQNVELVVLPLLCFTADMKPPLVLQRAVTLLVRHGISVIAAAGNHGENPPQDGKPTNTWKGYPAACAGATSVGATDTKGEFQATFSPKRADSWIQLAGPGIDVVSTSVTGEIEYVEIEGIPKPDDWHPKFTGYAMWSGSSFATATVGGAIAAKLIAAQAEGVEKSAADVIEELKGTSPDENGGIGWYGSLKPPPVRVS
ncbi:S8/S53 family peptidase [Lentzea sp. NPDC005914]|uniref:S8/S53 family peptidase n=1 Tax=Lentzea sp. NPDC005914 TaxID=3154572 RepID=UPI0033E62C3A